MKNMIKVLVIALITLTFSGLSFAQAKPATPPAPTMEKKAETKAKPSRITGEVTSVDARAGTFVIKAKDKEVNLNAESKDAKAALEKVKVGDMVRVSYAEKDGKMVATSVRAAKSKAATTEKKGATTEKKADTK
jgi:Cu/Ag efflux protein CusF